MLAPSQVYAWGKEGHKVTGYIAQQLLTEEAQRQLTLIVPNADFSQLALYMDQHKEELKRRLPGSEKWHYNDEPVCDGPPHTSPCAEGQCASLKIDEYRRILANRHASPSQRRQALTFLIHMIGDIHQPLHAADNNDRGGNDVRVMLPGSHQVRTLHALWDTTLVYHVLGEESAYNWANKHVALYQNRLTQWQQGNTMDWINESNDYARKVVYAQLPGFNCGQPQTHAVQLTMRYIHTSEPVVREQLVKAGARIAWVINEALDTTSH